MNRKGFTLIELLAVIVILGILMLIAIPSVTKYIDSSKKETYVKTVSNMVDVVRYGVISENSNYSMEGKTTKAFLLSKVELEKGSNKSPYGDFIDEYSCVIVTKTTDGYKYEVQTKDTGNYCIEQTDVNSLGESNVKKCDNDTLKKCPLYDRYSIGDQVSFAGSNWYVIKDSSSSEDYVTLMKEKVLTNTELKGYAVNYKMPYYWSPTCHLPEYYGYTSSVKTECAGHNNYERSKIKEFLEEVYLNTLDSYKLKSVDGYKIRLITLDELQNNLGYATTMRSSWYEKDSVNTPQWVYQDFGEEIDSSNELGGYWTMTPHSEDLSAVWRVNRYGDGGGGGLYKAFVRELDGVRPVINLLKSNISQ